MTSNSRWRGAPGEVQTSGPRFTARSLLLDKIFRRAKPARALDIGCGRGAITRVLARRSRSVLATEVTGAGVDAATTALRDCPQVQVRLANLFDGGSPDSLDGEAPFDLILVSEVLEHITDDLSALRTIWDLLSDDGLLVVTVPRDPDFWSVEDEMWDHKRRYTRSQLLSKFHAANFRKTRLWTWGFPVTKQIVRYQISRLGPQSGADRDTTPTTMRPPALLLPVARLTFTAIARMEQAFKKSDRGLGHIAAARKDATKTD